MKRAKTPNHILTLPLNCEPWQRDYLDKLFRVSGNIYNNLVADRLGALKQLERTKAWKSVQTRLSALYEQRKNHSFLCRDVGCMRYPARWLAAVGLDKQPRRRRMEDP